MLCEVCFYMLRRQEGRIWKGSFDLHFNHHNHLKSLHRSANVHCRICRVLFEEIQRFYSEQASSMSIDELPITVTAQLFILDPLGDEELFCLEFDVQTREFKFKRTFVLKNIGLGNPPFRTPLSNKTSSDEVYQLAMQWISTCNCYHPDQPPWYPARLINLEALKKKDSLTHKLTKSTVESKVDESDDRPKEGRTKVNLIEIQDWAVDPPTHSNDRYVTLSHCWGQAGSAKTRLTSENIDSFKRGIPLHDLPKTFRHAIKFASRLPNVGYIWIDSLCIKQGHKEIDDWLKQSADMDKVYSKAFLNISATAGSDSEFGLFVKRSSHDLLEDEVILNISGLPGAHDSIKEATRLPAASNSRTDFNNSILKRTETSRSDDTSASFAEERANGLEPNYLRQCIILDASFWADRVDNAPVNKRGWVLQERLMAPRVLHFCRDQVAWECHEFNDAEGQPKHMPIFHLTEDGIEKKSSLKGLEIERDGREFRKSRLGDIDDPESHLVPEIYAFELWRRIVEVYSKTAITNPRDKLIALSGIAREMSRKMGKSGKQVQYVAGLWDTHLASQLLWSVEPVFKPSERIFEHPSSATPGVYRAPSFSWASIDTNGGRGIRYAEVTDKDLFIVVEKIAVTAKTGSDDFGLLEKAHIMLRGKLRKAELSAKPKGRFEWRFIGRGELDIGEHRNVYLDCPKRDGDSILGPDAGIFVMPAALGNRTEPTESRYLICLILQLDKDHKDGPGFKRIGLTKLSPWADFKALDKLKILEPFQNDIDMPSQGYDFETGQHLIRLY